MSSPGQAQDAAQVISQSSTDDSSLSFDSADTHVAVQEWIDNADYIPKDIGYSWFLFCEALIENQQDVTDRIRPSTPPPVPDYLLAAAAQREQRRLNELQHDQRADGGGKSDTTYVKIPEELVPDKDPSKGSWDHVVYLPAWTDPDFREDVLRTPAGRWRRNTVSDAIHNLRPALRLEDAIKNPTEYALRFGIADGRRDGRSRMSPTWSQTRDPMDDFANQVDTLNEVERAVALELSREVRESRGERLVPDREILPEVMEAMLSHHGLLTNAQLKAEVAKAAENGMSLDQMVEELERKHPLLRDIHSVFLDNALDDQDYQRVVLGGFTTDEMLQYNVHTMSNDVVLDLDNPIHPLFERHRWLSSRWKGSTQAFPKLAYNLNGSREEWDITTNDRLWNALQPALRLASMIIAKEPPQLEALFNMCTRQPIDPKFDTRPNPQTPMLTKYVPEDEIDMSRTYPAIRELEEDYLFEWKGEVLRHFRDALELDIASGYTANERHYDAYTEGLRGQPWSDYCVGSTGLQDEGRKRTISIKLAAELIWPLLVDQYSATEKMACSFEIANTLIHEFAHAISQAQYRICENAATLYPRSPRMVQLLSNLKDTLFDLNYSLGEPYFADHPQIEAGYDLEHSLWGVAGFPQHYTNRYYGELVVFSFQSTYPNGKDPTRTDTVQPWLHFYRTLPLDTIAKFFRKSFWAEEFETYGWAALKLKSEKYVQKDSLFRPDRLDRHVLTAYVGVNMFKFLAAVPHILFMSRHRVLAMYLRALAIDIMYEHQHDVWWTNEIHHMWPSPLLHPLATSVDALFRELEEGDILHARVSAANRTGLDEEWQEMFRSGGRLMQRLATVYGEMQDEVGYMQHLAFLYPLGAAQGLEIRLSPRTTTFHVYRRVDRLRADADRIAEKLNEISILPEVVRDHNEWEMWKNRFVLTGRKYEHLRSTLDGLPQTTQTGRFGAAEKAQFDRLPTASWKPLSERYKKMAIREYERAAPVIRDTIDDYFDAIQQTRLSLKSGTKVRHVRRALQDLDGVGGRPRVSGGGKQSHFGVPALLVPPASSAEFRSGADPAPAPSEPPTTPASTVVFGEPGVMQTTLDNDIPRRVSKPSTSDSAGFRNYQSNLLGSPDMSQTWKEASDVFTSGVPQPLRKVSPKSKQLGQGSGRSQFQVFPNPFANRTVMTSEAAVFEEQKRLREQAVRMENEAAGIYKTRSLWREMKHVDSDEEMEL